MSQRNHFPILTIPTQLTVILISLLLLLTLTIFFPIPHSSTIGPGRRDLAAKPTEEEREFWRQPNGQGYRPCINFSLDYRRESARIAHEGRGVVVPFVTGGLNQQRLQIVDAIVIARILGAALALPVLKRNAIWGDASNFTEIFDVDHFKRSLESHVRIISSPLDWPHGRPPAASMPFNASPLWIRIRFSRQLDKHGVLVLKGLDSKLSKQLPLDLQNLRCKVAFDALRFTSPIRELGYKLARRMWEGGPYIALHLRLEKDVWVRSGCLPGLGPEFDDLIARERKSHPELLTGRLKLSHDQRRRAGLCPMNGFEVARLLRALGAPTSARIYLAGGEPLGGDRALRELVAEFPNLVTKETLALESELEPYANKKSVLAALDFIVAMSSDVFMPSHGGNMGRAMQGHRAYAGHWKYIKPDKREVVQLLEEAERDTSEVELSRKLKQVHKGATGQPEIRKAGGDVIAYPVPECMCKSRWALQQDICTST